MTIRELTNWNRPLGISLKRRRETAINSLESLQDEMNNFFERFSASLNARLTDWDGSRTGPAVDIAEDQKSFTVKAEMAGINPEDVEVETTEGFLTIRGQRAEEKEEKDRNYI